MFAPRSLAAALTGGGRYTLDVPVAALAGLSVAFVAFAMPADTLAELVGSTGLASLIPAAEPPLGLKARIALGAAGAVAVFGAAFLVLRWLDRLGTRSEEDEDAVEMAPPRLRRRDFHPDAPPRPPIMAAYEFGEPAPPEPVEAQGAWPEPEPEPEPESASEQAEGEDEWLLDRPVDVDAPIVRDDPIEGSGPSPAEPEAPDPVPVPTAAPAATVAPPSGSIDELMARLEQGLARRRENVLPSAQPEAPDPASPSPTPFPEAADDRLQSAIDSLQRLAARGD